MRGNVPKALDVVAASLCNTTARRIVEDRGRKPDRALVSLGRRGLARRPMEIPIESLDIARRGAQARARGRRAAIAIRGQISLPTTWRGPHNSSLNLSSELLICGGCAATLMNSLAG
jgi:hypothetical protein